MTAEHQGGWRATGIAAIEPGDARSVPASVAEAVAAARRGDGSGWDWLFDRYYMFVCRYAMARLGDQDAAEELGQEVFVAAVGSIKRLRESSDRGVEGWLLGIARNKISDRHRAGKRSERVARALAGDTTAAAPDASEVVAERAVAADLRQAIERLPDHQRDVVVRRFLLDESLETVAEATGRSIGAVKAMQHRALARLARHHRGAVTP